MPEKSYYLYNPQGEGQKYTEEQFNSDEMKNWLNDNGEGVSIYESVPFDAESGSYSYQPNDKFYLRNTANGAEQEYTAEQFASPEMSEWLRQNGQGIEISQYRKYTPKNYTPEDEARLNELETSIQDAEKRRKSLLNSRRFSIGNSTAGASVYTQTGDSYGQQLKALNDEIDSYYKERETNAAFTSRKETGKATALKQEQENKAAVADIDRRAKAAIDKETSGSWLSRLGAALIAAPSTELDTTIPDYAEKQRANMVRNEETGTTLEADRENFNAAANLAKTTYNTYDATSKDEVQNEQTFWGKVAKVGKGLGEGIVDEASNEELWNSIAKTEDNMAIHNLHKKIEDLFGGYENINSEEAEKILEEKLSDSEQSLLASYIESANASDIQQRLHWSYGAGTSIVDSAKMAAEMMALSPVTGPLTEGISNGIIRFIAKRGFGKGVMRPIVKVATKTVAEDLAAIAGGVTQTLLSPSFAGNLAEQLAQLDEDGNLVSFGRGFINELYTDTMENATEFGLGPANKALGQLGKTKFGKRFLFSPAVKGVMDKAGLQNFFEEFGEEVNNAIIDSAVGAITNNKLGDKEAWRNFWDKDNLLTLVFSFGPTIGGGTVISAGQRAYYNGKEKKSRQDLTAWMKEKGYDDATINNFFDSFQGATPEELSGNTKGFFGEVVFQNQDDAEGLRLLFDYAKDKSYQMAVEGDQEDRMKERRLAELSSMKERMGGNRFYQVLHDYEEKDGYIPDANVDVLEFRDGTRLFITGEADGQLATIDENGKVGFMSADDIESSGAERKTSSLKDFLSQELVRQEGLNERKRMDREYAMQRKALLDSTNPGDTFEFGHEGEKQTGIVQAKSAEGVQIAFDAPVDINGNTDRVHMLSWKEYADLTGRPLMTLTDEQVRSREAGNIENHKRARQAVNPIIGGQKFSDGTNDYTIIKAVPHSEMDRRDGRTMAVLAQNEGTGQYETLFIPFEELRAKFSGIDSEDMLATRAAVRKNLGLEDDKRGVKVEAPQDDTLRDFRGNAIPLLSDGTVDEDTFMENDMEAWTKWNDSIQRDGGLDSRESLAIAIANIDKSIEQERANTLTGNQKARRAAQARVKELEAKKASYQAIEADYQSRDRETQEQAKRMVKRDKKGREIASLRAAFRRTKDSRADGYQKRFKDAKTLEEKRAVLAEYFAGVATTPMEITDKEHYAEQLKAKGVSDGTIRLIDQAFSQGDNPGGIFDPASGIITIFADGMMDIEDARATYVHERQHMFTKMDRTAIDAVKEAFKDRLEDLKDIVESISGSAFYRENSGTAEGQLEENADELVSYLTEFAYTTTEEQYAELLDSIGIEGTLREQLINKDNGERKDQSLSNSRRGIYVPLDNQAGAGQNGSGESQGSGNVAEQGSGSAASGAQAPESGADTDDTTGSARARIAQERPRSEAEIISDISVNVGGHMDGAQVRFSISAMAKGVGLDITSAEGSKSVVFSSPDGKKKFDWKHLIKADDLRGIESPFGYMMADARAVGTVSASKERLLWQRMADMLNAALTLGSEENGGFDALSANWQWVGETVFKAVASNSDSQYSYSLDITRVCKKNEAVIKAIAAMQRRLGYGITPGQVMDIYLSTKEVGYQVPCPVCYVFSRYIRNGKYATIMINGQKKYGKYLVDPSTLTEEQKAERINFWQEELERIQAENDTNEAVIAKANQDITEIPDQIDRLAKPLLDGKVKGKEANEIRKKIRKLDARYQAALNVVSQSSLDAYIKNFAIKDTKEGTVLREDSWQLFPEEMALDLRETANVLRNYPAIQRLRNSRGAAAGKEITFEANNDIGEVPMMLGSKAALKVDPNNTDASNHYKKAYETKDEETKEKELRAARERFIDAHIYAQRQSLRGGQRMWSWSDNIERLGPDVFLNMLQLEMLGGALQSYSKQLEGINMVATLQGYVNGSLMGKGIGYAEVSESDIDKDTMTYTGEAIAETDEDGTRHIMAEIGSPVFEEDGKYYTLLFDDVVGIAAYGEDVDGQHHKGLFELNDELDRAGNIIVGMNDRHITLSMKDPRIFFIIPWHSSGANVHLLQQMYDYLGVQVDSKQFKDYTSVQEEKKIEDTVTKEGEVKPGKVSEHLYEFWEDHLNNPREIPGYGMVAGKDFDGADRVQSGKGVLSESQKHYNELRNAILVGVNGTNVRNARPDWYEEIMADEFLRQVYAKVNANVDNGLMTKDDCKYIYPYEYWDEESTYDTADINGVRYLEYCRRLGVKPKFCGKLNPKAKDQFGDFTEVPGFWKVLIDRRMYGVNGKFQDLTPVSAELFKPELVTPSWTEQNFHKTLVADDPGAEKIAETTIRREYEGEAGLPMVDYDTTLKDALKVYNNGNIAPAKEGAILNETQKRVIARLGLEDNAADESGRLRTAQQREALFQAAKDTYGVTGNYKVAGYMLPDGTMLDFSGKWEGGDPDMRQTDHRDIHYAMENAGEDIEFEYPTQRIVNFMNEGAIRMLPEYHGINISVAPTAEQKNRIRDYARRNMGEIILEISDKDGRTDAYVEYGRGTSSDRIINDIDNWFENGVKPYVPEARFRIGNARRETISNQISNKLSYMTDEQISQTIDEIERLGEQSKKGGDSRMESVLVDWVCRGMIILPQDSEKAVIAYNYAKRFNEPTGKIDNLNEYIESISSKVEEREADKTLIDPDTIPQFSNKQVVSEAFGIVTYDVEDTREGQAAVRRVVDSHFGKNANPWCLITRFNGESLNNAWGYWKNYSKLGKKIAFQNGKLIAFMGTNKNTEEWWDRLDRPHPHVPVAVRFTSEDGVKVEAQAKVNADDELSYDNLYTVRGKNGVEETYDGDGTIKDTKYTEGKGKDKETVSISYHRMGGESAPIEQVKHDGYTSVAQVGMMPSQTTKSLDDEGREVTLRWNLTPSGYVLENISCGNYVVSIENGKPKVGRNNTKKSDNALLAMLNDLIGSKPGNMALLHRYSEDNVVVEVVDNYNGTRYWSGVTIYPDASNLNAHDIEIKSAGGVTSTATPEDLAVRTPEGYFIISKATGEITGNKAAYEKHKDTVEKVRGIIERAMAYKPRVADMKHATEKVSSAEIKEAIAKVSDAAMTNEIKTRRVRRFVDSLLEKISRIKPVAAAQASGLNTERGKRMWEAYQMIERGDYRGAHAISMELFGAENEDGSYNELEDATNWGYYISEGRGGEITENEPKLAEYIVLRQYYGGDSDLWGRYDDWGDMADDLQRDAEGLGGNADILGLANFIRGVQDRNIELLNAGLVDEANAYVEDAPDEFDARVRDILDGLKASFEAPLTEQSAPSASGIHSEKGRQVWEAYKLAENGNWEEFERRTRELYPENPYMVWEHELGDTDPGLRESDPDIVEYIELSDYLSESDVWARANDLVELVEWLRATADQYNDVRLNEAADRLTAMWDERGGEVEQDMINYLDDQIRIIRDSLAQGIENGTASEGQKPYEERKKEAKEDALFWFVDHMARGQYDAGNDGTAVIDAVRREFPDTNFPVYGYEDGLYDENYQLNVRYPISLYNQMMNSEDPKVRVLAQVQDADQFSWIDNPTGEALLEMEEFIRFNAPDMLTNTEFGRALVNLRTIDSEETAREDGEYDSDRFEEGEEQASSLLPGFKQDLKNAILAERGNAVVADINAVERTINYYRDSSKGELDRMRDPRLAEIMENAPAMELGKALSDHVADIESRGWDEATKATGARSRTAPSAYENVKSLRDELQEKYGDADMDTWSEEDRQRWEDTIRTWLNQPRENEARFRTIVDIEEEVEDRLNDGREYEMLDFGTANPALRFAGLKPWKIFTTKSNWTEHILRHKISAGNAIKALHNPLAVTDNPGYKGQTIIWTNIEDTFHKDTVLCFVLEESRNRDAYFIKTIHYRPKASLIYTMSLGGLRYANTSLTRWVDNNKASIEYRIGGYEKKVETLNDARKNPDTPKEYLNSKAKVDINNLISKQKAEESLRNYNVDDYARFRFVGERGIRNAFGEESMRLADLEVAKQMEQEGKDERTIKIATGWERGADKKWRFEEKDLVWKGGDAALFNDGYASSKRLEDVIDDMTLFLEYPELHNVTLTVSNLGGGNRGTTNYPGRRISLDRGLGTKEGANSYQTNMATDAARSTLVHEVQHMIQYMEGFARGENAEITQWMMNDFKAENLDAYTYAMGFGQYSANILKAQRIPHLVDILRRQAPANTDKEEAARMEHLADSLEKMTPEEYSKFVDTAKGMLTKARRGARDRYIRSAGEVEARNAAKRIGYTSEERRDTLAWETEADYNGNPIAREEQIVRFRKVTDPALLERLDSEPTVRNVYRAMQLINGVLYPPMSAKVPVQKIGKSGRPYVRYEWRQGIPVDQLGTIWEQSEENPELVDEEGYFTLNKGNGDSIKARYNPYFHVSTTPLNDQFSSAQTRPELVTVEMEIPASEADPAEGQAYQAEKALDPVGRKDWHAGVIQGQLTGTREVILSRYAKALRIVPESEVADIISQMDGIKDVTFPSNVVTPQLRTELEARGIKFVETDNQGHPIDLNPSFRTARFEEETEQSAELMPEHDEVIRGGLAATLGREGASSLMMGIYSSAPEQIREEVVRDAMNNGFGFSDAMARRLSAAIATSEPSDQEAELVSAATARLSSVLGEDIPDNDAKWMLYNNGNRGDSLLDEARRARVAFRLGFDNASVEAKENVAQDVRFRRVQNAYDQSAVDIYSTSLGVQEAIKEAHAHMYISVDKMYEAIEKTSGRKRKTHENVLLSLNQLSSKNFSEKDAYLRDYLQPMWEVIKSMTSKKYGTHDLESIVRYVMLKHGLERNEVFAKRDARNEYKAQYDARLAEIDRDQQMSDADKDKERLAAEALYNMHIADVNNGTDALYIEKRKDDYSGLMALYTQGGQGIKRMKGESRQSFLARRNASMFNPYSDLADAEAEAQREVSDFEAVYAQDGLTDKLWDAVNAATKETLRHQYASGMLTKEGYNHLVGMFKYYVPLRGFKNETAEDLFTYMNSNGDGNFTAPVLKAKGRRSVADNPFGVIGAMAESAIQADNKNLAKLALYNFVANRPDNGLAELSECWYEDSGMRDANGKKILIKHYPVIDRTMTPDEIAQAWQDLENQMKARRAQGIKVFKGTSKLDLNDSVVNVERRSIPEHMVSVKVNGKDYDIIINANPRAAQAINGTLNGEITDNIFKEFLMKWNRLMSALATSVNPNFVVSNLVRDLEYAQVSAMADRGDYGKGYVKAFEKNLLKLMHGGRIFRLVWAQNGRGGKHLPKNLKDAYDSYVMNGGPTGYTYLTNNKEYDRKMEQYLKAQTSGNVTRALMSFKEMFDDTMEAVEQLSRFAAYLAAKETGSNEVEAVNAAKEITLNFNRKGSGKMLSWEEAGQYAQSDNPVLNTMQRIAISFVTATAPLKFVTMFYNAAVQSLEKFFTMFKKAPVWMASVCAGTMAAGAINAFIHMMAGGGGDDDDEINDYFNIPDYLRRKSFCINYGKGSSKYIAIPISQELAPFYALGDILVTNVFKKTKIDYMNNPIAATAETFGELLPFNVAEAFTDKDGILPGATDMLLRGVAFTSMPYSLAVNETFYGAPIHGSSIYENQEVSRNKAHWKEKRAKTLPINQSIAKVLNYATGGDAVRGGAVNAYPEEVKFFFDDIMGGAGKFWMQVINLARNTIKGEQTLTTDTPFLNRVMTDTMEKNQDSYYKNSYYWLVDELFPLMDRWDQDYKDEYIEKHPVILERQEEIATRLGEIKNEKEAISAERKPLSRRKADQPHRERLRAREDALDAEKKALNGELFMLLNIPEVNYMDRDVFKSKEYQLWLRHKNELNGKFATPEISEIDKKIKTTPEGPAKEALKAEKWRIQKEFVDECNRELKLYD